MGDNTNRKTPEELWKNFLNYLDYCRLERKFPNIAGFTIYANMGRSTFYNYMEEGNSNYLAFVDTIKRINQHLEDECINNHFTSPAERIFYLKNKFNYADKQEVKTVNTNINNEVKNMTDEEIINELASYK